MAFKEKLEHLKKTNPIFKDFEFKTYKNDMSGISELIDKLREEKRIEEQKEQEDELFLSILQKVV